jgi:hypothetical protein
LEEAKVHPGLLRQKKKMKKKKIALIQITKYNFACCFKGAWNVASHIKGRT